MNRNYFFCIDCQTFVDFFKYDNLEDTGHAECKIRDLTKKEQEEAIKECKEEGCFDEFSLYDKTLRGKQTALEVKEV